MGYRFPFSLTARLPNVHAPHCTWGNGRDPHLSFHSSGNTPESGPSGHHSWCATSSAIKVSSGLDSCRLNRKWSLLLPGVEVRVSSTTLCPRWIDGRRSLYPLFSLSAKSRHPMGGGESALWLSFFKTSDHLQLGHQHSAFKGLFAFIFLPP